MRRWFFMLLMLGLPALMLPGLVETAGAQAQAQGGRLGVLPDPEQMRRVEAAVDQAVEYLAQHQLSSGAWPHGVGGGGKPNNGINGMCLLALLGRGHAPDRGPYQDVVRRGVEYVLSTQNDRGVYDSPKNHRGAMYEHGLATLAMIEAYGFMPTERMRTSIRDALDLIIETQNKKGGWRYRPRPKKADLSVTVMQVVALRAAQNARFSIPQKTTDKAIEYVEKCAHKKRGFNYQPNRKRTMAQTAAGSLCLQLLGKHDAESVDKALKFLQEKGYDKNLDRFFYYCSYYAMQAHFQAGGKHWNNWHPQVRAYLLKHQNEDGSFPGFRKAGSFNGNGARCYSTALATMTLQVYMHYLPAYQR